MPVMQTKRRTPCLFIALMTLCVLSEKRVVGRLLRVPSAESTASWPATAASTEDTSSAFPSNTLRRGSSGATAEGLRASAVTSWPCASASRSRICPVAPVAPMMRTFASLLYVCRSLQWQRRSVASAPADYTDYKMKCQQAFRGAQEKKEKSAMWKRRLIEAFAIITVGDGLIEFLAPEEHSRLWVVGPKSTRRIAMWFVEDPERMRVLGAAQVVFGMWLALRQHRDISACRT